MILFKIYAVRDQNVWPWLLLRLLSRDKGVGCSMRRCGVGLEQRQTFPMLVLSAQTYLQFHKNFTSESINIVISMGTSKQAGLVERKKVVNFLFRILLLLESFSSSSSDPSSMLFDGLHTNFFYTILLWLPFVVKVIKT